MQVTAVKIPLLLAFCIGCLELLANTLISITLHIRVQQSKHFVTVCYTLLLLLLYRHINTYQHIRQPFLPLSLSEPSVCCRCFQAYWTFLIKLVTFKSLWILSSLLCIRFYDNNNNNNMQLPKFEYLGASDFYKNITKIHGKTRAKDGPLDVLLILLSSLSSSNCAQIPRQCLKSVSALRFFSCHFWRECHRVI